MKVLKRGQYGGAALEYVIVSSFAGVVSLVAIGYVAKLTKDKLNEMHQRIAPDTELDLGTLEEFGFGD